MVVEFLLAALLPPSIIAGVLALERVEERLGVRPGRDAGGPSDRSTPPTLGPAASSRTD
jgi:hypothetical protein